jgi:hypothetical protein
VQDVRLVAVSKLVAVAKVREAVVAGVTDLGENYLQEAEGKAHLLPAGTEWHSEQATGRESGSVVGSTWRWWAPTPRSEGLEAPFRSTGGAAFTTAGMPAGRTRLGSPWQASQLVIMVGWVRFATPFTWSSRFTVVLVKPGWQSAH